MDPVKTTDNILKYMFTLLGLVALCIGLGLTIHTLKFLEEAVLTEGTVIKVRKERSDGKETFRPFVSYRDSDGYEHTFRSRASSNPPLYAVGDQVEVLYRESLPEEARIKDLLSLWGLEALFSLIGTVFLFIGLALMFRGSVKRS